MVTPLEKIVNISADGGFSVKVRDYDGRSFSDAVSYMQEAKKVDISTTDGLEAYEALTGESLGGKVGREADFFKKQGDTLRAHGVMTYTRDHFSKLLGELDEEGLMNFALNYIPENPLVKPAKDEDVDPYEVARDAAYSAVKAMKQIESNPNAVIEEATKSGGIFAMYVAMNPAEYLEIEKSIVQERATLAIGRYGAKKFITTTKKGLEEKAKERDSLVKEIEKKARASGEQLTAQQRAELVKSENLSQYDDCSMVDEMYQGIIGSALRGIGIKEAERKRKEKEDAGKNGKGKTDKKGKKK